MRGQFDALAEGTLRSDTEDTEKQTVTSADGTTIAYDKAGSGPALILVAGAFSYRKFPMLAKLVDELAADFTVYNYDRRGRGDSTDTQPYAAEREIEDIQALIEVAGGSADVWGLSSGAVLSLHAAAPGLAVGIMRLLPLWKRLTVVAHTLPYDVAILGDKVYGEPLSHGDWADVKAPTLVIAGGKAPELIRTAARQLAEVLPDGEYQVLQGQSHNVSPKAIAPLLTEFFQS